MKNYLDLMRDIIETGEVKKPARENMPSTHQLFGNLLCYELDKGFPLVTTKKVFLRGIIEELIWFLRGDTNIANLISHDVNIWNEDGYKWYVKNTKHGETVKEFDEWINDASDSDNFNDYQMGALYGQLWRNFGYHQIPINENEDIVVRGVDQIKNLINDILNNPNGRYKVVTAWNPWVVANGMSALPSCHYMFQCNIRNGKYLDLAITQRSVDTCLGLPFNIASYAMLIHILSMMTGLQPGTLKWIGMDCHIYENQIELAKEQINREPKKLPTFNIKLTDLQSQLVSRSIGDNSWSSKDIDDFFHSLTNNNFELTGYEPHPSIKYPLSTGIKK